MGSAMNLDTVLVEHRDGVAIIKLNRPQRLNAMTPQLMRDLHTALEATGRDPAVRVAILTGEGRAFCAGDDLKETATSELTPALARRFVLDVQQITLDVRAMPQPLIAAVNGYALGGGCEIALSCDLVVAAENAQFGFPEVGVGLTCTGGITHILPRAIGPHRAKELILTTRRFDAHEADRLGLVNRLAPPERLLDEALALAQTIAAQAPLSVTLMKLAIDRGLQADLDTTMAFETEGLIATFLSQDALEGARAFVEKRQPQFRGA